VIRYTPQAVAQVDDLSSHYERLERTEASRNLRSALVAAADRISRSPMLGLKAPRPYPELIFQDRLWVKAGAYWIAYSPTPPVTILGVFHEQADIPGRA